VADKNREIEALRNRLKTAEEKGERSEERAKRAELKLLSEAASRNSNKRECGVQCEPRAYRWFNGQWAGVAA
jgi:hypothetical protein